MPETIHRPSMPYVGPIHCALHDGMKIKVSVKIERSHDQFQINLQCGPSTSPRSDVAFHFNPRFNQNQVVRNSLTNGAWGTEEKHGNFPFHKGFSYDVNILVKGHAFQVSVDTRHIFDFTHRVPIDRISHITVEGGVEIRKITYEPERHMNPSHHHVHHHGIGFDAHHDADFEFGMRHHDFGIHDAGSNMMSSVGDFFGGMFGKGKSQASKASMSITGGNSNLSFETSKHNHPTSQPGNSAYPQSNQYPGSSYPGNASYPNTATYPQSNPYPNYPAPSAPSYPGSAGYPNNSPYPANPAVPSNTGYPGNTPYPGNSAPGGAITYPGAGAGASNIPIMNPAVPFSQHFGPLYPGKMIFVSGIPHPNPNRFNLNFICGATGDVAFTLDVRFSFSNDRQELVRNTKQGGAWGAEERQKTHFPFSANIPFEIVILVESHCFKVAVNNQHLLEYNHRVQPLTRIDTFKVDGDTRLNQVRFQ